MLESLPTGTIHCTLRPDATPSTFDEVEDFAQKFVDEHTIAAKIIRSRYIVKGSEDRGMLAIWLLTDSHYTYVFPATRPIDGLSVDLAGQLAERFKACNFTIVTEGK